MAADRVAVLGAGAWGTALACVAARAGQAVTLWGRDPALVAAMAAMRTNVPHLPGIRLDATVTPTTDLRQALHDADIVLAAVPAQRLRDLLDICAPQLRPGATVVICAKGIEQATGLFLSQVAADCAPGHPAAILSGPSFAADVGRGLPTAVTVAAGTLDEAARLGARLGSASFRLYHTDDVRGVEIGGAAKNVLAIACGIAHGRGLGASAEAALVARAFAELCRFGDRMGGRPETLAGLSGLGDLVLTCASAQSRNFAFGAALGRQGRRATDPGHPVVEGVWTAGVLAGLAQRHDIDMPISAAVAAVLAGSIDVAGAIEGLLARPFRAENRGSP